MRSAIRNFWADRSGNYAMMTVLMMLPLMGALTIGVDYAEMSREKQLALNALDAAGIGTARRYLEGNITDAQLKTFAENFFKANYSGQDASQVKLTLVLPTAGAGGSTLKLAAAMTYKPYFLPVLRTLLGNATIKDIDFNETTEVRLKNTLEVAMALDNSGSMSEKGGSSGQVRMDLLKTAAKQLVDTLAAQGAQMKQVASPVQFSLVPFAASVNVGSTYANATWMDRDGIAPAHHENFDWNQMLLADPSKTVVKINGVYTKIGLGWPVAERNTKVTRITVMNDMRRISGYTTGTTGTEYVCTKTNSSGNCTQGYWRTPIYSSFASWKGCVEARPYPYNNDDTVPAAATPNTLFQPMFAPDETDRNSAYNNYWSDVTSGSVGLSSDQDVNRQKYTPKYFQPVASGAEGSDDGPNASCTTTPITTLTDVTKSAGSTSIKAAIDNMQPLGGTNVPEGMAWGWRTISSGEPFTQGRSEAERGNDKVVIVVTDGANTYYTPGSLGSNDDANNKSIYSSYGYASNGRLFGGTSSAVSKTDYSNTNYTAALNEQFKALCANAKANDIMVMTVAVDLNAADTAEKTQIAMLKACSSDSRYRKDPTDPSKPAKLFWNSTGASLANDFKEIGNELSNLRIVG